MNSRLLKEPFFSPDQHTFMAAYSLLVWPCLGKQDFKDTHSSNQNTKVLKNEKGKQPLKNEIVKLEIPTAALVLKAH